MQLELFEKAPRRPGFGLVNFESLAQACFEGYRAGLSLTAVAACSGVTRREAAGLALVYRDDDLCAILRECDSISTFFEFMSGSPRIREKVLGLLVDGKITKGMIKAAKQKLEKKPVVRRLRLVKAVSVGLAPNAEILREEGNVGEIREGFLPGFFDPVGSRQAFFECAT